MERRGAAERLCEYERLIVALLCAGAALRVLFFCAAFPVFNNVDEEAHFDMVFKLARGDWPQPANALFDREAAELIVLYGSPEFLKEPGTEAIGPPLWKLQKARVEPHIRKSVRVWVETPNHEAQAPPLYYALAAVWLDLGRVLGVAGGGIVYWLRFLNVPLVALLVWLGHRYCARLYPDRVDIRLGVPLLIGSLPQDAYYSINADLFSALLVTLMLLLVARLASHPLAGSARSDWLGLGLALSAALLVKLSNLPMLVVIALAAAFLVYRDAATWGSRRPGALASKLAILLLATFLPLLAWMASNLKVLGDPLGVTGKVAALGWTSRSIGDVFGHPIFTPGGLFYFVSGLIETLWRGEFVWRLERIALPAMDGFYVASSLFFLAIAAVTHLRSRRSLPGTALLGGLHEVVIAGYLGFFAVLSVYYEFGGSRYPSDEAPFFVSGRLMLGALVPFLILYIEGASLLLDRLFPRFGGRDWTLPGLLGVAVVGMLVEAIVTTPAFSSAYNWFAL